MKRWFVIAAAIAGTAELAAANSDNLEDSPRRWHVGALVGVEVPRADLDTGLFVGASGKIGIDREDRWQVVIDVDWLRANSRNATILSPPVFPRSANDLEQSVDVVTLGAGGSARAARFGNVVLRFQLAVGLQLGRAEFGAYGMSRAYSGAGPALTGGLEVLGKLGSVSWRAVVGWRESRIALDIPGELDGEVTSGALIGAGALW